MASVYRKKQPLSDSWVFTGFDRFGFAFQKGAELRDDFNAFLKELGPQELQNIVKKWVN